MRKFESGIANFEVLHDFGQILRDPSVPSHRVVRKTVGLVFALSLALIYYRHVVRGFGLWEPAFGTVALVCLLMFAIGLTGGLLAAGFYDAFLRAVDAQSPRPTLVTFFAEWLFAFTAPALVLLLGFVLGGRSGDP